MKTLTPDINVDEEVKAVAAFIAQKWTPIENLEQLVREIQQTAFRIGATWIDQYDTGSAAHDLGEARAEKLKERLSEAEAHSVEFHDAYCWFFTTIWWAARRLREMGLNLHSKWDFERRVSAVHASVASRFPGLVTARPHGWDALAKDYTDFDGQEEYRPGPDRDLFQGHDSGGQSSFTYQVALPYVMYSEFCQGRKASSELVGAIFSHFLGIREYLNTQAFIQALKDLDLVNKPGPVFTMEGVVVENRFLKVILDASDGPPFEEEYRRCVAGHLRFEAMSEEGKRQLQAHNQARIAELMASLRTSPTADDEESEKDLRMRSAFVKHFAVTAA